MIGDEFSSRMNHDFVWDHRMDAIESEEDKGRNILQPQLFDMKIFGRVCYGLSGDFARGKN
jgi:hypothetical protein